jgi:hypothetical protein
MGTERIAAGNDQRSAANEQGLTLMEAYRMIEHRSKGEKPKSHAAAASARFSKVLEMLKAEARIAAKG